MKQLRHALIAALLALSCPANDASAQAISNVLIPPGTIVGNLQGTHSGASALTFNQLAVALSQTGYLISSSPISLSTAVPPTPGTPGNAVVFGPLPYPNVVADAGGPPLLAPLTNVSLATMPAYTLKGNATGSTEVPTDISIPALTQKASPVAADKIMIADSAASNALKYATVSSIGAVGAVSSIAGNIGAFTLSGGVTNSTNDIRLSLNSAVLLTTALSNPTVTSSTTGVMMGFGVTTCRFTPTYSTRAQFIISGVAGNNTTGNSSIINMRYGTGAGPANGTAIAGAGTQVFNPKSFGGNSTGGSIQSFPFTLVAVVTGLSPGTAYWFDASLAASANTSAITAADCAAHELM
jgi:hypothetical protein